MAQISPAQQPSLHKENEEDVGQDHDLIYIGQIKFDHSLFLIVMSTASSHIDAMSKSRREAIVDQLRACKTTEEVLAYDALFNVENKDTRLYIVICDFLHSRTISRAIGARWLKTLLDDREKELNLIRQ